MGDLYSGNADVGAANDAEKNFDAYKF